MSSLNYDVVIIGGGPGGYIAAIRAAQLGLKTACIEKRNTLGGTCLNVGCIPSKALLESSEHYHQTQHQFKQHGIKFSGPVEIDIPTMLKRKNDIVRQLTQGIAGLFKKNKVDHFNGFGKLEQKSSEGFTISMTPADPTLKQTLMAKRVILATGSEPIELPFLPFDQKNILSSTEALDLPQVPRHLVVIGGGVIGLELGSVWLRLGAQVTVIEFQNRILPGADLQTGQELHKSLVKQGMQFKLGHKCLGITSQSSSKPSSKSSSQSSSDMVIEAENLADGSKIQLTCDKVLVSTGRKPYTQGLGLETLDIKTDKPGRVLIDKNFETTCPGIFAIGDIVDGPMLAHKAEEEGVAAAEIIAHQLTGQNLHPHVNYAAIPNVVYTWPELASVGLTEEEAKSAGINIKTGTFPFMANARAKTMGESEGFAKFVVNAENDQVLGVHIVGARASDMIAEGVALVEKQFKALEVGQMSHAHPTLAEIVKEAALAVHKRTLNF
jgi:dihydrolipoamide dehydrogenase